MPPKVKTVNFDRDLRALIDLTKTTQNLVTHFQSSLIPSANTASALDLTSIPNTLELTKASTTLLRSHTTTLSLLLLTPPLTPSALTKKIGEVSSGVLSNMVAAASNTPHPGQNDDLGQLMRAELRAQVRRLLGTWGEVLTLVLHAVERCGDVNGNGRGKDEGPTERFRQDVLAATGVVWEACDALLKICEEGVVGLVVKKAEEWRSVLLDAVEELKEWGEDVNEDEDEGRAEGSDGEDVGFGDEDEIFGAANKLGKGDKELKALLDTSVKKLKMVGMLYQALIKRRLKTFPITSSASKTTANGESRGVGPMTSLDQLMASLKYIPETVDDLASAFYDLDEREARKTLDKTCGEAKSAAELVKHSWSGQDDEFTTWSRKWVAMIEAS